MINIDHSFGLIVQGFTQKFKKVKDIFGVKSRCRDSITVEMAYSGILSMKFFRIHLSLWKVGELGMSWRRAGSSQIVLFAISNNPSATSYCIF
jgi:hypothetical protein